MQAISNEKLELLGGKPPKLSCSEGIGFAVGLFTGALVFTIATGGAGVLLLVGTFNAGTVFAAQNCANQY